MANLVQGGNVQFLIATHSPIILTFPGAALLSFDDDDIQPTQFRETSHYQITRGILKIPDRYWALLLTEDELE